MVCEHAASHICTSRASAALTGPCQKGTALMLFPGALSETECWCCRPGDTREGKKNLIYVDESGQQRHMKSEDDKLVERDDGSLKAGQVVHVVAGRHTGLQVRLQLFASQSCSQPLPRVGRSHGICMTQWWQLVTSSSQVYGWARQCVWWRLRGCRLVSGCPAS